ncbi:MAG: phospholipase [Chlamydiae bacterium]|nr:MAG: phospholipase [Chlamydiota bacterium]
MIEFITDKEIYEQVILNAVPKAKDFVWIGTSDIKDMYIKRGTEMIPFLKLLSELIGKNVSVRLIHAKEPGPVFREDFDKYKNLISGLERILCPRIHFKCVILDGKFAYSGSANLTGAGMGAKSETRRNFESGIITDDELIVSQIMEQFDSLWMGKFCGKCKRKEYCADYREMLI